MSDFFTNLYSANRNNAIAIKNSGIGSKLLAPVMLMTSVGLFWKINDDRYKSRSAEMTQNIKDDYKNEMKRAHAKIVSNFPTMIRNLNDFTYFEIQAITNINTQKNKMVGRQRSGLILDAKAKFSAKRDTSQERKLDDFESDSLPQTSTNLDIATIPDEKLAGSSSIMSTSSVATNCSESHVGGGYFSSILKKQKQFISKKTVTFSLPCQNFSTARVYQPSLTFQSLVKEFEKNKIG